MSDKLKELRENSWSYSTGRGGGDVQADWNESDSQGKGFIKNKPFGNKILTYPEQTITGDIPPAWGYSGNRVELTPSEDNPTIYGATELVGVSVVYDGKAYELEKCENGWGNPTAGESEAVYNGIDPPIRIKQIGNIVYAFPIDELEHTIKVEAEVVENLSKEWIDIDVERIETNVNRAQTTANQAQTTANQAQTTANQAQTTANQAQTTANSKLDSRDPKIYGSLLMNTTDYDVSCAVALGTACKAKNNNVVAVGYATSSEGKEAISIGYQVAAIGERSFAVGHALNSPGTKLYNATITGAAGTVTYTIDKIGNIEENTIIGYNGKFARVTKVDKEGMTVTVDKTLDADNDISDKADVLYYIGYAFGNESMSFGSSMAIGYRAVAIGNGAVASGANSLAIGNGALLGHEATANGIDSLAIGYGSTANGKHSVAIGVDVVADGENQFVIGRKNKQSDDAVFIVGFNNTGNRKNVFEVKKNGDIEPGNGVILKSSTGKRFRITVDDTGALTATAVE